MILGIWVIILPFLGFSGTLKSIILFASGLIIAGVAYALRSEAKPINSSSVPYIEHKSEPAVHN